MKPDQPQKAELETITRSTLEQRNGRILAVDDDPKVLDTYQEVFTPDLSSTEKLNSILQEFNISTSVSSDTVDQFSLDIAENGKRAIAQVESALKENRPYAVIFMDIRMPPGIDGLKAAEQIRLMDDEVYIVFVSAYSDYSAYEMQCKLSKNMMLISKPFEEDVIKQVARMLCMNWERENSLNGEHQRLQAHTKLMEYQATHDSLTGVYNRHYLNTVLEVELNRAHREWTSMGVLMVDIDWFKRYNDQYGHIEGDRILKRVAQCMVTSISRPADFVARYGGEEFCVVLPNTDEEGVMLIAEKLRGEIEALKIPHEGSETVPWITVSIGGICCIPQLAEKRGKKDKEPILGLADEQLYKAKRAGKNCSVVNSCE